MEGGMGTFWEREFTVRRGWVLWKPAFGQPGCFNSLGFRRTEFPGSSTFECPCQSDSGQKNAPLMDCRAPREPLGMAALLQTLSCFWNSSLGKFKEEKKNLNCVELLYLLHCFFFWKDKLVNRVIWNTIWQSFIFDILKATCSTHWSSIAEQECVRGGTGAEAEVHRGLWPWGRTGGVCMLFCWLLLVDTVHRRCSVFFTQMCFWALLGLCVWRWEEHLQAKNFSKNSYSGVRWSSGFK